MLPRTRPPGGGTGVGAVSADEFTGRPWWTSLLWTCGQRWGRDLGHALHMTAWPDVHGEDFPCLEGERRFQMVRILFCFSLSIQIPHRCSSSVATVAHVRHGLRRGRVAALRPLDEVATGTFLTATTGSSLASHRFCLFCFYAAVLTPRPCPSRFQADAAAVGVVGRGRVIRQGTAAAAGRGW